MSWLNDILDRLAREPVCGYYAQGPAAAEPTALAAMALAGHGRSGAAQPALAWLAELQQPGGSVGVDAAHPAPCWPTGWAALAWQTAENSWSPAAERAIVWILATKGTSERRNAIAGHDTTLQAWPWVEGTHSWIEPTAISLLALKRSGLAVHPRSREAVRLILDRMLPGGGWNQGSNIVMDRVLRPQVQPTGLALAALGGEAQTEEPVERSLGYLRRALAAPVSTTSLSYALIGMAAQGRRPAEADRWLAASAAETLNHGAPPYPLALAALAALGSECPWFSPRSLAGERAG